MGLRRNISFYNCRLFAFLGGVSRRLAVRMGKRSAYGFPFAVFGDDGFPFKAKIRTILENSCCFVNLRLLRKKMEAYFVSILFFLPTM